MSRIGRLPVPLPKGVQVDIQGKRIKVKGPKGELEREVPGAISVKRADETLVVERPSDAPAHRALHGTVRALLNNMVLGVSTGFTRSLIVEGVGYRAELKGKDLVFSLGYSHPIVVNPPTGIAFASDEKTRTVTVSGIDKELVGQVAADIRKLRPPEPYKGKGLRYSDERIRRKAGKAGKVG